MSKEDRFEIFGNITIKDNKEDHLYNTYQCSVIMNQLNQENQELKKQLAEKEKESNDYVMSAIERYADLANKLAEKDKEIEALKQKK